ncbi:hypothetical protein RJ639_014992 [Escallonia herrerae]|uniref:Methyltransferase type 12 domain-containing protein n=1 Tax=Escallonia herrerae TaxID=1293975 RepID=A0AA88VJL5_9ASTE|nr:hypothetical protein RJ639_014992 [Escallonia herrerae]
MRVLAISIPFVSFRLPSVAGSIMAVRRQHSSPPLTGPRNMALQARSATAAAPSSFAAIRTRCTVSGVIHPVSVIYVYYILFACECNNVFLQFFKDRHYLEKEWGQNFSDENPVSLNGKVVLEVGCGAGNTIFPLVAAQPKLFIHACDFSPNAISLVKSHTNFNEEPINVFVCDITEDDLCDHVTPYSVDTITLQIFTLSAVSPSNMPLVIQKLKKVVKVARYFAFFLSEHCSTTELYDKNFDLQPKGSVLFRDYAVEDFAQVKLHNRNQIISENFYYRGDGTSSFYFSEDFLSTLFLQAGFSVVDVNVYCREVENRS